MNQATKTTWGNATPVPADPQPTIVRRPAWSRIVPALAFVAIGVVLVASGLADSAAVIAIAAVCCLGGFAVAAMYGGGEVCSQCRRPLDFADGNVPVQIERVDELRHALERGDTRPLVFSLTGIPVSTVGDHASIDLTHCKCRSVGTIGASVHRAADSKPARLVAPVRLASPHLDTLAERAKI